MSRIKNVSRTGWVIAGVVATLLIVPTVAVAATGAVSIKGTSGNKADVTIAGGSASAAGNQLLTTEASPAKYFVDANNAADSAAGSGATAGNTVLASAPAGSALVVKTINLDVAVMAGGGGPSTDIAVSFYVCIPTTAVLLYVGYMYPTGVGDAEPLTFDPGIAIPSGDALCAHAIDPNGRLYVQAAVIGYTVASVDVPAPA